MAFTSFRGSLSWLSPWAIIHDIDWHLEGEGERAAGYNWDGLPQRKAKIRPLFVVQSQRILL